ncbi:MAG: hypothetical protein HGA31_01760 [Candidatus Moranbacteria bacterium]|nr:hypothetical protein [Candidatus Moranbacteria bacterium]
MARKILAIVKPNGASVGLILRELVRRAVVIARRRMTTFDVTKKVGYGGRKDDVLTNADTEAQKSYVKSLRECFPKFSLVGEEDALQFLGKYGVRAYFTIDPIDGTRAYIRRQSHGVGSMIALVIDGVIESAYIGDVNTQELFGYRPGSSRVWRITDLEISERLRKPRGKNIGNMYIQLRVREHEYSDIARKTIDRFKSVSIDGGSIGTWAARLWKQEVGALLIPPSAETPWDSTPVIGISKKLGYVFLRPLADGWIEYEPVLSHEKYYREHETLIIHRNHIRSLEKHMSVQISG